jgi:hypothetical protein
MKYSADQVEQLLKEIHDGKITDRNLPKDLYFAIAEYLKDALYKGFGGNIDDFAGDALNNLLNLRDNIYLFSGAKNFQFIKEATELLVDENGVYRSFSQYKPHAEALYQKYNVNWLEAEHKTTIGQGQMASRWQDIQRNIDVLPILRFSTNGHPCPICDPFEGLTARATNPIWRIASPLMHFGCFCVLESHDDETQESDKGFMDQLAPNLEAIPPLFRNNPGMTGEVFNKSHPYFDVPKKDKKFAQSNFNLPVPENDGQHGIDLTKRIAHIKKHAPALVVKAEKNIIEANESSIFELNKELKAISPTLKKYSADLGVEKYEELAREYNEKVRRINDLQAEIKLYKNKYAERAADLLKAPRAGAITLNGGTSENIVRGHEIFKKIVGDKTALQNKVLKVKIKGGRAGYQVRTNTVLLSRDSPLKTVAHEMGHWLEDQDPEYFAKIKDFYQKRTAGESVKTMSQLRPGKGYSTSEIIKEDKFWNAYTGKLYTDQKVGLTLINKTKQYATEITSMWFTHVLEDLEGFIKNDPEHFEFIYKLLHE